VGISVFDERQPSGINFKFTDGNTPGASNATAGNAQPSRVDHIFATSNDSIDHVLDVRLHNNNWTTTQLGSVNVPAGAGFDPAISPIDLLFTLFPLLDGIPLDAISWIEINCAVAMSAGTEIHVTSLAGAL